jgi:hypothetical protein
MMEPLSQESIDDDAVLREELVAYLDGELGMEQSRRVEQRAAAEPRSRRMLEDFDRTWHFLDELVSPASGEDFTRTTMEMVALAAEDDAAKAKADAPRRRRRARLLTVCGLAGAAAIGFFLVWRVAPDPSAPLLDDLPLLENYSQYREIQTIDFLRALYNDKLFTKETDGAANAGFRTETVAQRRKHVEDLNADQREYLIHNEQVFHDLSAGERQHFRELHEKIEGDPDRDRLVATMNRYSKWFEEQPMWWRGELQRKGTSDRIKEIKRQLTIQKIVGNEIRLDAKNRQAVANWMESYVTAHEQDPRFVESVLSQFPRGGSGRGPGGRGPILRDGEQPAARFAKLRPDEKHPVLREMVLRGWQSGNPPVHPTDAELASLRESLSPEIRERLESRKPDEQTRIIAHWLRQTASTEHDERLADFFEHVLNGEERDRLMSLPGVEIDSELGRMYMAHLMSQPRSGDPNRRNDQPHRGDLQWPGRPHPGGPSGAGGVRRMGPQADREAKGSTGDSLPSP